MTTTTATTSLISEHEKACVVVDSEKCKGCEICVVSCPEGNLKLSSTFNRNGFHPVAFSYHGERGDCTACGICYWVCPDFAIAEVWSLRK